MLNKMRMPYIRTIYHCAERQMSLGLFCQTITMMLDYLFHKVFDKLLLVYRLSYFKGFRKRTNNITLLDHGKQNTRLICNLL